MAPAQMEHAAETAMLIATSFGSVGAAKPRETYPKYAHDMMLERPALTAKARPILAAAPIATANQLNPAPPSLLCRALALMMRTVSLMSTGYGNTYQKKKRDCSGSWVSLWNRAMNPQTAKRPKLVQAATLSVFMLQGLTLQFSRRALRGPARRMCIMK